VAVYVTGTASLGRCIETEQITDVIGCALPLVLCLPIMSESVKKMHVFESAARFSRDLFQKCLGAILSSRAKSEHPCITATSEIFFPSSG
jgi:hypothetical protein